MNRISAAFCMVALALSSPASGQRNETYRGETIDVIVDRPTRERPERDPRGSANRPTEGPSRTPGGGPRGTDTTIRTVSVSINGQQFRVPERTKRDLEAFMDLHRRNGGVFQGILGFVGLFRGFGLLDTNQSGGWQDIQGVVVEIDDAVIELSGDNVGAAAWRALALRYLDEQTSPMNANRPEQKMWVHLRHIFRNPHMYRSGGIRRDPSGKLAIRPIPGEGLMTIDSSLHATTYDTLALAVLVNELWWDLHLRDYLSMSRMGTWKRSGAKLAINKWDLYLLNRVLHDMPPQWKNRWAAYFREQQELPVANRELWLKLQSYLSNLDMEQYTDPATGEQPPVYEDRFWPAVAATQAH